jgi:hypothetical protein
MSTSIPPNNNTGLYNNIGGNQPISGNVTVTNLSATGNITAGGYFVGNGTYLTNVAAVTSNYANTAGTAVYVTGNAQANITSVGTLTGLTVSGNIAGGNLNVSGNISDTSGDLQLNSVGAINLAPTTQVTVAGSLSATGNIAGGNLQVSGNIFDTAGNLQLNSVGAINLAPTTQVAVAGSVSATGNITGAYILGNGSQLSGLPIPNLANYAGSISATGNITGQYILGNGSQLTGLPQVYGNANVAAFLASGTDSSNIITTANVTGGNLTTSGTGGNITGVNFINANYFVGDGSYLTNVTGGGGNVTLSGNLSGNLQGNTYGANAFAFVNVIGNITGGNILTGGQVSATGNIAGGNLQVNNNANIVNNLSVGGTIYGTFAGNISGNLVVPGSNTQVIYNNNGNAGASANFTFNSATNQLSVIGNVVGNNINGNGSGLSNLTGANVTGTVANATYATSAGAATTAGTVTTAAQPNITSVGTLTSLTSSGNISTTGNITGAYLFGNGSQLTGLSATYGNSNVTTLLAGFGSNTISSTGNITTTANVAAGNLIMSGGLVDTTADLTLTSSATNGNIVLTTNGTGIVSAVGNIQGGNLRTVGQVSATGNITSANYFVGNGYYLTGISGGGGGYGNSNVASFLAAYGANTISMTGNITTGNISATGNVHSGNITLIRSGVGNAAMLYDTTGTANTSATIFSIVLEAIGNTTNTFPSILAQNQNPGDAGVGNFASTDILLVRNDGDSNNYVNTLDIGVAGSNVAFYGAGSEGSAYISWASSTGSALVINTSNNPLAISTSTTIPGEITLPGAGVINLQRLGTWYENNPNVAQSGGTLTIDASVGQVQSVYLTAAVTTVTFSNFATLDANNKPQTDTVTVLLQQGATPRAVTMPSGTAYRYAGGANTVSATANSTVMLSITGTYNYNTAATQYLITISPAFS